MGGTCFQCYEYIIYLQHEEVKVTTYSKRHGRNIK